MMRMAAASGELLRQRALGSFAAFAKAGPWSHSHQQICHHSRTSSAQMMPRQQGRKAAAVICALPFSLSRPQKSLKFSWGRKYTAYTAADLQVEVDILKEGTPRHLTSDEVDDLLQQLEEDAQSAVPLALQAKKKAQPAYYMPAIVNLSIVLCDDGHIQQLNKQHRGKDAPTDVLSFEIPDESLGMPLPVKLLGDLVISLETAQRQADERGYSLLDELRVLLVHGLLHLCGFDHEKGEQQLQQMAQYETDMLSELGWTGSGLIAAVGAVDDQQQQGQCSSSSSGGDSSLTTSSSSQSKFDTVMQDSLASSSASSSTTVVQDTSSPSGSSSSSVSSSITSSPSSSRSTDGQRGRARHRPRVPLVALDMDGTLLDSSSNISPESAAVIRAACASGVKVILATGKARPAALAACRKAGLEGEGLLVSLRSPGVFLQGLAVHGHEGQQLSDAALPADVVAQAFTWATAADVSCVAFLGDECVTLRLTDELRELHTRYYEPLAQECSGVDELLKGPAVRKLLFMTEPERVDGLLKPHWHSALQGQAAEVLQAVPNMLEVVPAGVNKWAGLQVLIGHMQLTADQLMAVGDGSNDLQMVANAGLGIAMGNAVSSVKQAAATIVSSNDEGGIVEAFEKFVL